MATDAALSITGEQLLAMRDDGVVRWIRAGRLEERPMTVRNRHHSRTMAKASQHLCNWADSRPAPAPVVLTGDAAIRLATDPETTYGVDLAVVSAEMMAAQPADHTIVEGAPILAAEILSPSEMQADIEDKVDAFLAAGTAQVWLLNPRRRTVTVHRRSAPPRLLHSGETLSADPELPGFAVGVAALFG